MSCSQKHIENIVFRVAMLMGCLLVLCGRQTVRADAVVTTNGNHVIVINATYAEYGEIFNELLGDGPIGDYMPTWFNADRFEPAESAGGGPPTQSPYVACNAIFVKNTEDLVFAHEFGIDGQAMQDVVDLCQAGGVQMEQIEAYNTNNGIRYAYICYDKPGPQWEANIELTAAGHDIVAGDLEDEGFRTVNICLTENPGGSERITSLFKKDSSDTYVSDYPILYNDLYSLRLDLADDGYRMTSLEVVNNAPWDTRYLPVFKKTGAMAFTYEGEAAEVLPSVAADINEEEMQGMHPVLIANVFSTADLGSGWWAQPLSYVLWRGQVKARFQTPRDFKYEDPIRKPGADDYYPDARDPFDP